MRIRAALTHKLRSGSFHLSEGGIVAALEPRHHELRMFAQRLGLGCRFVRRESGVRLLNLGERCVQRARTLGIEVSARERDRGFDVIRDVLIK